MTYIRREWEDRSLCAGSGSVSDRVLAAKFCPDCPVKKECYIDGVIYNEVGIWGGTKETKRSKLPYAFKRQLAKQLWLDGKLDPERIGRQPMIPIWIAEFEAETIVTQREIEELFAPVAPFSFEVLLG